MSGGPQVGDKVRLKWNGFPQVPRYMEGWQAEVVRDVRIRSVKRGFVYLVRVKLLVGDPGKVLPVRLDQIEPVPDEQPVEQVA